MSHSAEPVFIITLHTTWAHPAVHCSVVRAGGTQLWLWSALSASTTHFAALQNTFHKFKVVPSITKLLLVKKITIDGVHKHQRFCNLQRKCNEKHFVFDSMKVLYLTLWLYCTKMKYSGFYSFFQNKVYIYISFY